jgi:RND superfamily putative drug exporter
MDYEVFLVSRMREDFVHGDTAQQATLSGMGQAPGWSPPRQSS